MEKHLSSLPQNVLDQLGAKHNIKMPLLMPEPSATQKEQDAYQRLVSMYRQKEKTAEEIRLLLKDHPAAPKYTPPPAPPATSGTAERIVEKVVVRDMTAEEMRQRLAELEKSQPQEIKPALEDGKTPEPAKPLDKAPGPAVDLPPALTGQQWDDEPPIVPAAQTPAPAAPKPKAK